MTGTITQFATEMANIWYMYHDQRKGIAQPKLPQAWRKARNLIGIWGLYLIGAILGEVAYQAINL
jgi:hypothetical protein